MSDATYLGNPNLKRANVQQEWTKKQLLEYSRCMEDPLYFIQNYVRIVSLDEGLIPPMGEIGDLFANGELFVPEMLLAARAMKAGLAILKPTLTAT